MNKKSWVKPGNITPEEALSLAKQARNSKEVLKKGYTALKPIYEKTDIAINLRESSKLNDPAITKGIQSLPKFNELMELID